MFLESKSKQCSLIHDLIKKHIQENGFIEQVKVNTLFYMSQRISTISRSIKNK